MKKIKAVETSNLIPLRRSNPLISKGYDQVIADWLARFSSPHTVRVYSHALKEFLSHIRNKNAPEVLKETEVLSSFLLLEQAQAYELVSQYEGWLIKEGLAPATINRKLASIKSLVNYASEIGKCYYTLSNIKTKTVTIYRDTSGISTDTFKLMLDTVDRSTIKGKRDYAILLLLWGNALRRSEVTSCQIKDFDPLENKLWILGKGKKGQLQSITLGQETKSAIGNWLEARENYQLQMKNSECGASNKEGRTRKEEQGRKSNKDGNLKVTSSILNSQFCLKHSNEPLFCAVHKGYWGHQLNTDSIYKLVKKYAKLAGIPKTLSPHRLRHSAITAALEATNGDVRSVQKLSRHSSLNTLMIYDDNRRNEQGRVTKILESLL